MTNYSTWEQEDTWWRDNFQSRPYAAGRTYEEFRPAYQYGFESGSHHAGRTWKDAEAHLRTGWDRFEGKGEGSARWEDIKDAVRDAWHRVTGQHDVDTDKMAISERERLSGGARRE